LKLPTPLSGPDTNLKALIADDDGDMRLLIATAFRRAGFEVHEAADGNELQASFVAHATARTVVVSDIGMPECGGIEATIALKKLAPLAVILLVTAFADPALVLEAHEAGAAVVLHKPLKMAALVQAARSLLAH
jgi:CheY-like chemotaxis protein